VLAFLASIVEAFTGYLSQQNFNSRWIATNGKDAFNAVGVGGFWQMMSFGQILLWHIVLMPLILLALVGLHLLLVRYRGVCTRSPPAAAATPSAASPPMPLPLPSPAASGGAAEAAVISPRYRCTRVARSCLATWRGQEIALGLVVDGLHAHLAV
jgi:hypothetical protein